MRSAMNSLLPVLAALFALGVLGMPAGVAAQEDCVRCHNVDGKPPECVPKLVGEGWHECTVVEGVEDCEMSSDKPDCGLILALVGRAVDVPSTVAAGAVGGTAMSWSQQLVAPAAEMPPTVTRQACTGAIVQRRYSPESIADIRAGLRRVTI